MTAGWMRQWATSCDSKRFLVSDNFHTFANVTFCLAYHLRLVWPEVSAWGLHMNTEIFARQWHGACTCIINLEYLLAYLYDCEIVWSVHVGEYHVQKSPNDFARK